MTKSQKPTPKKASTDESAEWDTQSYKAIGIVFLVAGFAMVIPEGTRATGLPFLILGLTFFAISQQESSAKRKK